jgi:membrane-bound lytic murein transglycosylase D
MSLNPTITSMRYLLILFFLSSSLYAESFHRNPDFPVKGSMRVRVDFWKKVYTQITTKEGFIHDQNDLSVIYKRITLKTGRRGRRAQNRIEKNIIRGLLRSIAKKNYKNLSKDEKDLEKIIGKRSSKELYTMAKDVRIQYGLRDRYYKGLIRSYSYLKYIEKVFSDLKIPHELTYLPHVESSFNYHAYSKVGAAGIWQFMRSTARIYGLKVGYIVDERRDPLKATKAAARLLRDNHRLLKTWPLALTAYNHGPRSVKRAIKKVGSTDINEIIENYGGRRFGFASKNFYATFMATVEISEKPEGYFPSFKKPKPYIFSSIILKKRYTLSQIKKELKLSNKLIKEYNPAIRRAAYRANLYLPKGFEFRIPVTDEANLSKMKVALSKIKDRFLGKEGGQSHIITKGESLYDIARIYKVSLSDIVRFNNIPNPSLIYAGMRVKIPGKKDSITRLAITKVRKKEVIVIPVIKAPAPKVIVPPKVASKSIELKPLNPEVNLESYHLELKKLGRRTYQFQIETEETLGHFADWAGIKTQKIRNLNRLRYGRTINFTQKLKISLSEEQYKKFLNERAEYHLSIQEDFYETFEIASVETYTVKRGDNLTEILRELKLPYWLLRKSQPKGEISDKLFVGQKITYPKITTKGDETSQIPEES